MVTAVTCGISVALPVSSPSYPHAEGDHEASNDGNIFHFSTLHVIPLVRGYQVSQVIRLDVISLSTDWQMVS